MGKLSSKIYYDHNKEKYKKWNKNWRDDNKDKTKIAIKKWRDNNKEYLKEYNNKRNENNKENIKISKKLWYNKNKEHIKEYRREYTKNRRKNDILFKLTTNIRNRINLSFKRGGYSKKSKTCEILGCSYDEFKFFLEKKFTSGMSWLNQGEWHLDHIIPVSIGKTEDEIIILNHYTNFQPLWGNENIEKSDKIINIIIYNKYKRKLKLFYIQNILNRTIN